MVARAFTFTLRAQSFQLSTAQAPTSGRWGAGPASAASRPLRSYSLPARTAVPMAATSGFSRSAAVTPVTAFAMTARSTAGENRPVARALRRRRPPVRFLSHVGLPGHCDDYSISVPGNRIRFILNQLFTVREACLFADLSVAWTATGLIGDAVPTRLLGNSGYLGMFNCSVRLSHSLPSALLFRTRVARALASWRP